jgi:acetyl esterase/lipase
MSRTVEAYGGGPLQQGEWWLPDRPGRLPTVVLVHGGYWRPVYDRSLEDAVAADLCARGYLVWNIDYAAADVPWPGTLTDVAAGYDHLVQGRHADRVDHARIATVGHSAGGHLALWLASRHTLPASAPGAPTGRLPRPALGIGEAPVAALADGARAGLGGGAVLSLVGGGPEEVPARYGVADPEALLPIGVPTVLIHGTADDTVPLSQSERYVAAATAAGDRSRLMTYAGGHFEHLDPTSRASDLLRAALVQI